MPRPIQEILDHADDLAKRFEDYEPQAEDDRDPTSLRQLRDAVLARSDAERSIRDAVAAARSDGPSWAAIGSMLGTSGEAARQRYGHPRQRDHSSSAIDQPGSQAQASTTADGLGADGRSKRARRGHAIDAPADEADPHRL